MQFLNLRAKQPLISYWEKEIKGQVFDFSIIGAGFTGLFSALFLKEKYPDSSIIVIDRTFPPSGASTKNAGFSCFGSVSEILDDLQNESSDVVYSRVFERIRGIKLISHLFHPSELDYQNHGGYEIFKNEDQDIYSNCVENIDSINKRLKSEYNQVVFRITPNHFGFNTKYPLISNPLEGQLNPYKLWNALYKRLISLGVLFQLDEIMDVESETQVSLHSKRFQYRASKLIIATNAFTRKLIKNENVFPRRGQVLITKPINGLKIRGVFHYDMGYVYFRNVKNSLLIGGGRNIDFKSEETDEFRNTDKIIDYLKNILKETIIPNTQFEVDHCWSGIMGFGADNEKDYIVKQLSENAVEAVRLGGMGVALAPVLAKKMVNNFF